jgi:ABC-type multidrug transport system ATPase subunit
MIRIGGLMAAGGKVTYNLRGDGVNNPLLRSVVNSNGTVSSNQIRDAEDDVDDKSELLSSSFLSDNTRVLSPSELSRYVGYVPQEDVLDRSLTVREQLLFHARTRLANQYLGEGKLNQIVEEVMIDLNILHIGDSVIGGNDAGLPANISGGQLKRVNIAIELVALSSPAVLLLDEPTSGLDASIAYELVESLDALKKSKNITILCVLQQPRNEIFELMDHLLLMGPNGGIVYEGQVGDVRETLVNRGYEPYSVEETSDADFCIDVLNEMKWEQDLENLELIRKETSLRGVNGLSSHHAASLLSSSEIIGSSTENVGFSYNRFMLFCYNSLHKTWFNPIFYVLIYYNMKRLFKVRLRNRTQLIVNTLISLVMAVSLASGFSIFITDTYLQTLVPPVQRMFQDYFPSPLEAYNNANVEQFGLTQLLFFLCACLGCSSCLAAVPVFAGHGSVALREKYSGLSMNAYGIGRMIGDLPFVFLCSMVYCGIWCAFGVSGSYYNWMATILCTSYAASAIGYISGVFSTNNANVYGIILTLICCVFSGSEPSLAVVSKYPLVSWPWYVSFGTWTSESAYITWSAYLTNNGNLPSYEIQQGADRFGYDVSNGLTRSTLALIAIGTGLRIIVLIFLNKM